MKPRVWENKKTKDKVRAMPWWEMMANEEIINEKDLPHPQINKSWKFGMLVQIGWLIENKNGVFFGVAPEAKELFNDLGEWKPKKKKSK